MISSVPRYSFTFDIPLTQTYQMRNLKMRPEMELSTTVKLLVVTFFSCFISACTSYGVIENTEKLSVNELSLNTQRERARINENEATIILAFSGGGSRAAALSFGVLQALESIKVSNDKTLLDEIDIISAVSGGSITAAYYGLNGKRIFSEYREKFLYQDNESRIVRKASSLSHLSSNKGRSEAAIEYFDQQLFSGAQISQLTQGTGPNIILNSSDLGRGVRLSFTPEYFDLLCSDVSVFPISRAVVASAAVPLLFNPIVVRNYQGCGQGVPGWLKRAKARLANDEEMSLVIKKLETLTDKNNRQYIHLVDGGITDNLGLRAIYETVELAGGAEALSSNRNKDYPEAAIVIVVDASTEPQPKMDTSLEEPSLSESINAVTDIQIHRYNAATLKLFESKLEEWATSISTTQNKVTPYFVKLRLQDLSDPEEKAYFNNIPTSFTLQQDQVDKLINKGSQLLTDNHDFIRFIHKTWGQHNPVQPTK